ncbi:hypothetical protein ACPMCT_20090 [Clostridioides difficile]|uniref:hypothetical protein n=1 Tax=Clostridioides difficile TaxID=1496 RepID=UPI00038CB2D7|nr:hypothetical protein [Clostridioides difficile]EQJ94760.1 hypothetical protein QUA_0915 [Clostridioides difficile P49]MBY1863271.1 hypothetical protein [Clostridioides difficile]MBZ0706764.1 hypothetical protein [Clostridioides difficile]MCH7327283.1 hypothetical protein [Clostridioides difficile]MCI4737434.1 hypothetical protein [Clostridioides difficile]
MYNSNTNRLIEINTNKCALKNIEIVLMENSKDYIKNFKIIYSKLLSLQLQSVLLQYFDNNIIKITDTYSRTLELLDEELLKQYLQIKQLSNDSFDSDVLEKCKFESYKINKNLISNKIFRLINNEIDCISLENF